MLQVGAVVEGFVSSRTIVSVFGSDQLPARCCHFAQTGLGPFGALSVHGCVAAYGRATKFTPSFESATWLTPDTLSVAAVDSVTWRWLVSEPGIERTPFGGVVSAARAVAGDA